MPAPRRLVLVPAALDSGETPSFGAKKRFVQELARYNTAPDGSPAHLGVLFGPGFRVETAFVGDRDPLTQALITITEEDNAWPVLTRLCRETHWRLQDIETGRSFGP